MLFQLSYVLIFQIHVFLGRVAGRLTADIAESSFGSDNPVSGLEVGGSSVPGVWLAGGGLG